MRIRPIEGESDLESVAHFFSRNGYGPGIALDGSVLGVIFRERGVRQFLLAEDRGKIVGTIGFAEMSGRRVAPPGQLFAGMFVIAPSHRAGTLAGRLFAESFERLVASGVRGLRVEVDPTNARAFPLYVRVGFRAVSGLIPDEDGYVELVSVLPGVTADVIAHAEAWTGRTVTADQRQWRAIRRSREQTVDTGVTRLPEGAHAIRYDFELPGRSLSAEGRVDDASVIALLVDGVAAPGFTSPRINEPRSRARTVASRALGDFLINVRSDGALDVTHPDHLGLVLRDAHPAGGRSCAGARRPCVRDVTIDAAGDRWLIDDGTVTRSVRFSNSGVRLLATASDGGEVVCFPWMGLRIADLSVSRHDRTLQTGHAVRGRWPVDLTDFEAAADVIDPWSVDGLEIEWADRAAGISAAVTPIAAGAIRVEGWHLARMSGEGALEYEITLESGARATLGDAPPPERPKTSWEHTRWGSAAVLTSRAPSDDITVAPDDGLVQWTHRGRHVLTSAFPSARVIGALSDVSTALWVTRQQNRADLDAGAVWPVGVERLPFDPGGRAGWCLTSTDGPGEIGVRVRAEADGAEPEIVVYLALPAQTAVRLADSGGIDEQISPKSGPWRTWTRKASFRVEGGWLHLRPVRSRHPEILVRSTTRGLLVGAFARPSLLSEDVSWGLVYETDGTGRVPHREQPLPHEPS
ncbi:GNAT family N-acetyltransferase [uncultured Microbacterium sp.]|uniref:GNAT family N-acetyltransferase n=1 Tax=uncultured Microbacterium sp. TaxID=191216 RepID=UPI0025F2D559|nr:GNAT family N-acetyltransferase [uncultured Microbacterium sp.]